jgi:hypothetical protein
MRAARAVHDVEELGGALSLHETSSADTKRDTRKTLNRHSACRVKSAPKAREEERMAHLRRKSLGQVSWLVSSAALLQRLALLPEPHE